MNIGGLQRFSLIDYPGKICAIVFTQGCNFKCPYCHNPELSHPDLYGAVIPEAEVLAFLEKRRGKLDAVSISGGEPTLQPDIIDFTQKIRKMDYRVKIDTNGSHPDILETLINDGLVDYIAMDVKAPADKYGKTVGVKINPDLIARSIELIKNSDIPYEFRTTVVKSQLTENDLIAIAREIKNARRYILQKFVPSKTRDPKFMKKKTYSDSEFEAIGGKIKKLVQSFTIR